MKDGTARIDRSADHSHYSEQDPEITDNPADTVEPTGVNEATPIDPAARPEAKLNPAQEKIGEADAVALQMLLAEALTQPGFADPLHDDSEPTPAPNEMPGAAVDDRPATQRSAVRKWTGRIVKSALGLAVLVFAVWTPILQLFQVASAEAVINAPVVTLRAPISGIVADGSLTVGEEVVGGETLMRIANPRIDLSRLEDTAAAVQLSLDERLMLETRIASLEEQQAELEVQLENFRLARMELLDARLANASLTDADRIEAQIERDALERGVFIGDSYNDKPSTGQRLDSIAVELSNLEAALTVNLTRHPQLVAAEAAERSRATQLSTATVAAPAEGSIWEVLVSPGEQINEGQDLVRVLDCSRALVTAAVSESVYNQLAIGMAATFTLREGGEPMMAEVVYLSGVSAAPSNLAIAPGALQAESYRVMLSVPVVASGAGCAVGHTGRVVFDQNG